ncbi:MAG: hypothetical protein NZ937_09925, partial [Armatimonadetes bacterium]|nr:hypothetical protein [Armatimonadota bacterium]
DCFSNLTNFHAPCKLAPLVTKLKVAERSSAYLYGLTTIEKHQPQSSLEVTAKFWKAYGSLSRAYKVRRRPVSCIHSGVASSTFKST